MRDYGTADVERLLGIPRSVIRTLVDAGFVVPVRGPRNALRFGFRDLVLLRTAQGLAAARVPTRRIRQSLARLKAELPAELPLSGIRISALGTRVVVHDGTTPWQADSGQYLLDFAMEGDTGTVRTLGTARVASSAAGEPSSAVPSAPELFERGCALEADDPHAAEAAYRAALAVDGRHLGSAANLGTLLQAAGRHAEAETVYRAAIVALPDEALLHYNLATVLEDTDRVDAAIASYAQALALDPAFADAHYNLARLHEKRGDAREAVRHLAAYARLDPT